MSSCSVTVLGWAGSCEGSSWGFDGNSKGSSNGELGSGTESARELSVEGVEAFEDAVLDEGVMVAARSRGMNLPLTLGWLFQDVLGARLSCMCSAVDVLDKRWKHVYGMR
jgi:hypothetical protein